MKNDSYDYFEQIRQKMREVCRGMGDTSVWKGGMTPRKGI